MIYTFNSSKSHPVRYRALLCVIVRFYSNLNTDLNTLFTRLYFMFLKHKEFWNVFFFLLLSLHLFLAETHAEIPKHGHRTEIISNQIPVWCVILVWLGGKKWRFLDLFIYLIILLLKKFNMRSRNGRRHTSRDHNNKKKDCSLFSIYWEKEVCRSTKPFSLSSCDGFCLVERKPYQGEISCTDVTV